MRHYGTFVSELRNGWPRAAYQYSYADSGILQRFDRLSGWPDRRPDALSPKARIDKLCTERKGILPSQNADADRDRPERLIQDRDRETECRIALALDTSMDYLAGLTDVPTCRDCLKKREKISFPSCIYYRSYAIISITIDTSKTKAYTQKKSPGGTDPPGFCCAYWPLPCRSSHLLT